MTIFVLEGSCDGYYISLIHLMRPLNNFTAGTQHDKHLGWRNEQNQIHLDGTYILLCERQ